MNLCLYDSTVGPVNAYMEYLPEMDKAVLTEAMEDLKHVDQDDLLDLLSRREAKVLVTVNNIKQIVTEMAHKDLIQVLSFVAKTWEKTLKKLRITPESLQQMY